jgi:hypothetical protein
MRQRLTKSADCNNGDFVFVMNHDRFEQHNTALVAALKDCGLLKVRWHWLCYWRHYHRLPKLPR